MLDGVDVRRLALVRVENLAGDRVEDAAIRALLLLKGIVVVALALASEDDLRAAIVAEHVGAREVDVPEDGPRLIGGLLCRHDAL